ncbi:MAG: LysE family transporter [Opitutales bacterium]|nr:LysE family transporter [Opitutales bacterium]NRA27584.1 LysE family transporter [Opitutales bacterium]
MEFILLASAHLAAVISPGPDLAVVLRQSVRQGRPAAIATSIGIGSGIFCHATFCIVALPWIAGHSGTFYVVLKYAGGTYLFIIGLLALRAKESATFLKSNSVAKTQRKQASAFALGFLTNALNPKALLFFISVFTLIISPDTSLFVRTIYGIYLGVATTGYFALLSTILTIPRARTRFQAHQHWLDQLFGVIMITLAIGVLVSD